MEWGKKKKKDLEKKKKIQIFFNPVQNEGNFPGKFWGRENFVVF